VKRILEVNSTLHMVTEINPDAWSIAIKLDEERACGKVRGQVPPSLLLLIADVSIALFTVSLSSSKTTSLLLMR